MLGILGVLAAARPAPSDASQSIIPSLDLQQVDVREALRRLFGEAHLLVAVAPDVRGTITLSLRNVSFETALQNVTRQVDATYRIDRGWYEIVHREDVVLDAGLSVPDPNYLAIESRYAALENAVAAGRGEKVRELLTPGFESRNATDTKRAAQAIRILITTVRAFPNFSVARVVNWRDASAEIAVAYSRHGAATAYYRDFWRKANGQWRLAAREETVLNPPRRFESTPVSEIVRKWKDDFDISVEVDPRLAGRRVSVDLTGLSFEGALTRLVRATGATYRVEAGVYRIVPREGPEPRNG